jgi:hypothetical protein
VTPRRRFFRRGLQYPPPGLPDIVHPRYGEASLADVIPGVLRSVGVPDAPDPLGLHTAELADARIVVVLLVDGYGHYLRPLAAKWSANLTGLTGRVLTSGFPSTTPTSLTSLGTGAAPGSHGLLGFFLNVPGTDRVLNHIMWRDDPDPMVWQPLSTQFDIAEAAGVAAHVVGPPEFVGSGLTTAAYRGSRYVGASGIDEMGQRVGELMRNATGPTVIYAYRAEVDKAGHLFGIDHPVWRDAVSEVDRLVGMILDQLPPGAALVVTADHGQLNVPIGRGRRFDLDADARLRAGIAVVAGEPRVRYLHTEPGAHDDVLATWRGVLGSAAWVVSREEAVAQGWFGPVPEAHLQRIGDVVAACTEDFVILAGRTDPPPVSRMIAFHGSATAVEMAIPLLIHRRP